MSGVSCYLLGTSFLTHTRCGIISYQWLSNDQPSPNSFQKGIQLDLLLVCTAHLSITASSATNGFRGTSQAQTVSNGRLSRTLLVCTANLLLTASSAINGSRGTSQAQTVSNGCLSRFPLGMCCVCLSYCFFGYQWLSCNQPGPNSIQ